MHFGNSAGNFGGSAVRQPVGHDSAAAMSRSVSEIRGRHVRGSHSRIYDLTGKSLE